MSCADLVFVYGTLRRGESNHCVLGEACWHGFHRTRLRYTLVNLGAYPGAIPGGCTAIVGEVYTVSRALLAELDRLEDYPHEYTRERIATPHGSA